MGKLYWERSGKNRAKTMKEQYPEYIKNSAETLEKALEMIDKENNSDQKATKVIKKWKK